MKSTMRDTFLTRLLQKMREDDDIVLLSADFGAPVIDEIRTEFPDRFFNTGIAEQNLINLATGFALEGYRVVAYAIAPFITMRCFEQIRVNLAILSQLRPMNVTLVGVGAGFSYDVSGPTHHCIEDLTIMSTLPNVAVYSPSDHTQAPLLADHCLNKPGVKYLRFDAKPHLPVADNDSVETLTAGFRVLQSGKEVALVCTGYMTHVAHSLLPELAIRGLSPTLIDLVAYNSADGQALQSVLGNCKRIFLIQEALVSAGAQTLLSGLGHTQRLEVIAARPHYSFEIGSRDAIHEACGLGRQHILDTILGNF
ncbi:transketolase family protein [Uliginosibacterium gangwonense]|uniref:transketolase family protein n=1 Tax=Uliginosibacterium gangwonense TaxID=392736 RepID=UPI000362DA37|nr:transketolase C-terminal domain-containing protein [Uliginosibacterium gangwonense]